MPTDLADPLGIETDASDPLGIERHDPLGIESSPISTGALTDPRGRPFDPFQRPIVPVPASLATFPTYQNLEPARPGLPTIGERKPPMLPNSDPFFQTSPQERQERFITEAFEPSIKIPQDEQTQRILRPFMGAMGLLAMATKTGKGISSGVQHLAEGFTSPVGIATLGIDGLPVPLQRAVSLAFAYQMASQTPEIATQLGDEFGKPEDQRDWQKIGDLITEGAGGAGLTVMAGKHGLAPARRPVGAPELPPRPEPPPDVSRVSTPVTPPETPAAPAQDTGTGIVSVGDAFQKALDELSKRSGVAPDDLVESLKQEVSANEAKTETKPEAHEPEQSETFKELRLEGVTAEDAQALIDGRKTVKEVVEGNFTIVPSRVVGEEQGHDEAFAEGYNQAIERLTSILGENPEADEPSVSINSPEFLPAVRTKSGAVVTGKQGQIHAQVAVDNNIPFEDIQDRGAVGRTGKYIPTYSGDESGVTRSQYDYEQSRKPPAEPKPDPLGLESKPEAPAKRGGRFFIRPRSDGRNDILDDIQQLGGLKPPGKEDVGGEYDGWKEGMAGTARLLINRSARHRPDTIIPELQSLAGDYQRINNADDLYSAIQGAVAEREGLRATGGGRDAQDERFWSAATNPKNPSGLVKISVDDLKVGHKFRLRGPDISNDELEVTHVDPQTGEVTVKDGRKLGTQTLPEGAEIWVQRKYAPGDTLHAAGDFAFDQPESVEDQRARLDRERQESEARDRERAAEEARATRERTTRQRLQQRIGGDMGEAAQGGLFEEPGQQEMFRPKAPKTPPSGELFAAGQRRGLTVEQVTQAIHDTLGTTELPRGVRVVRDESAGWGARIDNRNRITVNAAQVSSPERAGRVIIEEGLHGVWFDPSVQKAWASIRRLVTNEDMQKERELRDRQGLPVDPETLREEAAISKLVEGDANRGVFARFYDIIRQAFKRVFGFDLPGNDRQVLKDAALTFLRGERESRRATEQPQFATGEPKEKDLVAVHNTTAEKIRHMLKLGGMAVPSVAIIRPSKAGGFEGFGDVTLVGNPDLVKPSRETKVLNADAYSPRYPTVNYFPDQKGVTAVQNMVQKTLDKLDADHKRSFSKFNLFNESPEKSVSEALKKSPEMMLAYLDSIGEPLPLTKLSAEGPETHYQQQHDMHAARAAVEYKEEVRVPFEKWVDDQIESLGITQTEKIYKGFTPSGNRSYLPHDLDTVVKIMKKGFKDAEGFNYGVGSIRAVAGKQFRTLEGIQADREKIVSKAVMEKVKNEIDNEFIELENSASSYRANKIEGFGRLDAFSDDMKAMAEGGSENWKYLREQYPGGEPFPDMQAFLDKLRNLPTEYFEAKIKRAVGLHEFTGAVVPDTTPPELIQQLQKHGLDVRTYKKGDAEARRQTVDSLSREQGVSFAAGEHPPEEPRDWREVQSDRDAATEKVRALQSEVDKHGDRRNAPVELKNRLNEALAEVKARNAALRSQPGYVEDLLNRFNAATDDMAREDLKGELTMIEPELLNRVYKGMQSRGIIPASQPLPEPFSSLQSLTDWLRAHEIDSPRRSFMERLNLARRAADALQAGKDTLQKVWNRSVAYAKTAYELWKAPPIDDDFRSLVKDWNAFDEQTGLEGYRFQQEINRRVDDPRRRAALMVWIQAGGIQEAVEQQLSMVPDRFKSVWKAATKLTPDEKKLANQIRSDWAVKLDIGQNAGLVDRGRENYGPTVWSIAPQVAEGDSTFAIGGALETRKGTPGNPNARLDPRNPFFSYHKSVPTYFDGIMAGGVPETMDVGKLVAYYHQAFNKALSSRAVVKAMLDAKAKDGRAVVILSGRADPMTTADGETKGYVVDSSYKGQEAQTADGRPYQAINHFALKDWKFLLRTEDGKPIMARADMLVHPDHAEFLKNVLGKQYYDPKSNRYYDSPIRRYALGRGALKLNRFLKESKFALSPFHLATLAEHALSHTVNPWTGNFKLDLNDATQRKLVRGGLDLGFSGERVDFQEGLSSHGGLWSSIPGIGDLSVKFTDFLFKDYLPSIKMKMAMEALERNQKRYKGKLTDEQIHDLTASQANAAFGSQNYRLLGRSSLVRDTLSLSFVAPDFLASRLKFVGQALKPHGAEQRRALLIMSASLYVGARVINSLVDPDNDPHWGLKDAFSVVYKGKRYSLRTVTNDIWHAITDPRSFWYNRLSPITRTAVEVATKKDWRGVNRTALEQLQDVASWIVPASMEGFVPGASKRESGPLESVGRAVGVMSRKDTAAMQVRDMAQKFNRSSGDPEAVAWQKARDQETLPDSAYRDLDTLLESNDLTAAKKEYDRLLSQGHKVSVISSRYRNLRPFTGTRARDDKFYNSLSESDRKIVDRAREEHRAQWDRFQKMFR